MLGTATQPKPDLAAFATALKSIQISEDYAFDVFPTDRGDSLPSGLSGTKCVDAARLLLAAELPALRAVGLWAMGRCLEDGEEFIYQGEAFGEKQLCLEAVRCDPLCSVAYPSYYRRNTREAPRGPQRFTAHTPKATVEWR